MHHTHAQLSLHFLECISISIFSIVSLFYLLSCLFSHCTENKAFDTRITFMLDRIYDLKNNKQKLNDTDTSLETAKKFVKNLVSKRGVHGGASQLRVSWYAHIHSFYSIIALFTYLLSLCDREEVC